ncbi:hypothetical protein HD806DRAFT_517952 [Xylariaceae sp. AK1471]|nr:hypothetical protein HD806DRAFT_517952 [Xylariaceae sp. AK1471]
MSSSSNRAIQPGGASPSDEHKDFTPLGTLTMRSHFYPHQIVPSDEALLKSLFSELMENSWELLHHCDSDEKDEYHLPPSLTGNSVWIQRKEAFFNEHPDIDESKLYNASVSRSSSEFRAWIEARFNPITIGQCGPTQDLCFIVDEHVMWVDPMAPRSPVSFVESSSAQPLTARTGSSDNQEGDGHSYKAARVLDWRRNFPTS